MLTKIKQIPILLAFFCGIATITAQNTPEQSLQIKGYTAVLHPIVTLANGKTDFNSFAHYTVGVPIGINIFKTQHFGFSFEVCPFIKSENGVDKVSNFLFHPGVVLRYAKGFSLIPRLAF